MPVWGIVALTCATGLVALLIVDRVRWVRANAVLAARAAELDAWPIASVRGTGSLIFLLHRETRSEESPFLLVQGDSSSRITAQEVWTLWNRSRIRWYGTRRNRFLGMRQFGWYVNAHRDSVKPLVDMNKPAPKWLEIPVLAVCALVVILLALAFVMAR